MILLIYAAALPATYTLRQLYEDVSNEYAGENVSRATVLLSSKPAKADYLY